MKKIIIAFIVLCLAGAIGYGVNEYNIYSSTTMKKTEVVLYEQDVLHVDGGKEKVSAKVGNPSLLDVNVNKHAIKLVAKKKGKTDLKVKCGYKNFNVKVDVRPYQISHKDLTLFVGQSYKDPGDFGGKVPNYQVKDYATSKNGMITATKVGKTSYKATIGNTMFKGNLTVKPMNFMSEGLTIYDNTDHYNLYSKNSDKRINPASITKVLSVYTYLKTIKSLDEKVKVKQSDIDQCYSCGGAYISGFKANETVTYRDLIYSALLVSGGEAIFGLERLCFKNKEAMRNAMNKYAKEAGMNHSHFENPVGMSNPSHYMTGNDIVKMMKFVLKDPTFKKMFFTKSYQTTNKKHTFKSPSSGYGKLAKGAKTGYTVAAKMCIVVCSQYKGHTFFIAQTGANNKIDRFNDIKKAHQIITNL
jgi:D-alanyl-D-alanine carboxypeptidase